MLLDQLKSSEDGWDDEPRLAYIHQVLPGLLFSNIFLAFVNHSQWRCRLKISQRHNSGAAAKMAFSRESLSVSSLKENSGQQSWWINKSRVGGKTCKWELHGSSQPWCVYTKAQPERFFPASRHSLALGSECLDITWPPACGSDGAQVREREKKSLSSMKVRIQTGFVSCFQIRSSHWVGRNPFTRNLLGHPSPRWFKSGQMSSESGPQFRPIRWVFWPKESEGWMKKCSCGDLISWPDSEAAIHFLFFFFCFFTMKT